MLGNRKVHILSLLKSTKFSLSTILSGPSSKTLRYLRNMDNPGIIVYVDSLPEHGNSERNRPYSRKGESTRVAEQCTEKVTRRRKVNS